MTGANTGAPMNPFADDVVREPREVSFSVKGLNDGPLNTLLHAFAALDAAELPRSRPVVAKKAQLVVSPDRGYGKSHLLGRLFTALGRRAIKVYLRPFQDPYKAWHSILLLAIQELNRPDDETVEAPSQLDALGVGTLAHILADFLAQEGATSNPDIKLAVPVLRQLAIGELPAADKPRWMSSLARMFADAALINRLSALLSRRHINLQGREKAWLKILAACAFDVSNGEGRNAALKWLRAEPLETEEAAVLRLDQADNDGNSDSSRRRSMNLATAGWKDFASSLPTIGRSCSASTRPSFMRAIQL